MADTETKQKKAKPRAQGAGGSRPAGGKKAGAKAAAGTKAAGKKAAGAKAAGKNTRGAGRTPAAGTGAARKKAAGVKAAAGTEAAKGRRTVSKPVRAHRKVPFEKAGNMLYPAPAVLVSCIAPETGEPNVFTVAWTGNLCTDPPMVGIAVRPERHSYPMIRESGEFVINLTTADLARETDFCGVRSGRDVDKFKSCGFTPEECEFISPPAIKEAPVSLECEVRDLIELGTHDLFLAEVLSVHVDEAYLDDKGAFRLEDAVPLVYCHGKYFALGKELGYFGYSIAKAKKTPQKRK